MNKIVGGKKQEEGSRVCSRKDQSICKVKVDCVHN